MDGELPRLGVGLGYRASLHEDILGDADRIDFLEVVSDQYLYASPGKLARLAALAERFPLVPHGVGMSIGTATSLDAAYLDRLAALVATTSAAWFSDHLGYTRVPDIDVEQLTPLWFTEESLAAVCRNVRQLGQVISTPFLLENITYYFVVPNAEMAEAQFLTRVLEETDTGLLLDVRSVWVNAVNLGFDPYEFLAAIPLERTVEVHLVPVADPVWALLAHVLERAPVKAVVLECDRDRPRFDVVLDQLDRIRRLFTATARP